MKNMNLLITLAAGLALCGVLRADDTAASAAATSPSAAAMGATTTAATPAAVTPDDAPGSLEAGKALLDQGKFAEAAAYFEGIGEQVKDHGKAKREPYRQLDLATAYLGAGQYQQAAAAASKAVALKKDLEPAWNDLAAAQVNGGDRAAAIATYTKAIAQLKTDQVDTTRLEANLAALQAAADHDKKHAAASGTTPTAAAPAAAQPASGTAAQ